MTFLRPRAGRLPLLGAALALPLLALFAPAASATPAGVVCATGTPLGAATGYTEFVLGNGQRGSESEGAIAYGGNLNASGMTVGTRLSVDKTFPSLVVAGTGNSFNLQKGSAYVGNLTGHINYNGGGSRLASNPIDFTAAFADLRARADRWADAPANGTAAVVNSETTPTPAGGNVLLLTGTDAQLNVFSVAPAQLTGIVAVYIDAPTTSTILINVSGSGTVDIQGKVAYRIGGGGYQQASDGLSSYARRTLWNIPDASTVKLGGGAAFGGTVFAPRSHVQAVSIGHNVGQVIAAQFSSNYETHQHLLLDDLCVPGPPAPPADADVSIVKTADKANPAGGDLVTYTLKVKNNGPGTAKDVVVTDAIPPGVTFDSATAPGTHAAGIVTFDLGDVPSGTTHTLTIRVTANPLPAPTPSGGSNPAHLIGVGKVESQVDLEAGDQQTVELTCPTGQILTDGSVRADHVDQDTGTLADVRVLSAQTTGVRTWKAVVRNDATGRAQAKAFAVCIAGATEQVDGHAHGLTVSDPVTKTQSVPAGRTSITVPVPAGGEAIVPGFAFTGDARLVGSEPVAGGWRFDVEAAAPQSVTLSLRVLGHETTTAGGHVHGLRLDHLVKQVTVAPGQVLEAEVTCADDAKGIVATFALPPGLVNLGNDPRPKTRAFKLLNPTGAPLTATIDLTCLADRTSKTGGGGTPDPVTVVNTATVTSDDDPNPANDSSSATVVVGGSGGMAIVGFAAVVTGDKVAVPTSCPAGSGTCTGTAAVKVGGTVIASGAYKLKAGATKTLKLKLRKAGLKGVGDQSRGKVTLKPKRGKARAKTITVLR